MKKHHTVPLILAALLLPLWPQQVSAQNTAYGTNALFSNTTGTKDSAFGYYSMYNNTSGVYNSAFGYYSLYSNATSGQNVAMGDSSLYANTGGFENSAFGHAALTANTTGSSNVAIGSNALAGNTSGLGNTAVGAGAMTYGTISIYNVAVGYLALANSYGQENIAIGHGAISYAGNNFNIGIGESALGSCSGTLNVAIGYNAAGSGSSTVSGTDNIAVGDQPLLSLTTGNYNVAVGTLALSATTTGGGNLAVGYHAGANVTGGSTITIGTAGVASESNSIRIGDPAVHTATYIAGINGETVSGGAAVYVDSNGKLGTGPGNAEFEFLLPAPVGPQPAQLSSTSAQVFTVTLSATTNNTTRTSELTLDGNAPVTSGAGLNVLIPPANSSWCYVLTTVASGNGLAATDQRRGVLKNHGGTISFAGPADVSGGGDTGDATGAGSWRITQVTTTPGRLKYTVTQGTTSAFTVNWTAKLEVIVAPN